MSQWNDLQMDIKITKILNVKSHDPMRYLGRSFLTSYQIAIRFKQLYPKDFGAIGKKVGGKGIGRRDSLAQYIALELSKRIEDRRITNIERSFLYRKNLLTLKYKSGDEEIESSSMQAYDLSIFRLKVLKKRALA